MANDALPTVPSVDLQRYAGRWYEVARLPNRFERKCVGDVTATYGLRAGGGLDVLNQCRLADGSMISAKGVARLAEKNGSTARLEVRFAPEWLGFLPFVWGGYWVIALADDYSWSMVGAPDREYLWILSRNPGMARSDINALLVKAQAMGFDTSSIVYVQNAKP